MKRTMNIQKIITYISILLIVIGIGSCGLTTKTITPIEVLEASYRTVVKDDAKVGYEMKLKIGLMDKISVDSINFRGMQFVPSVKTEGDNIHYSGFLSVDINFPGTDYVKGNYPDGIIHTRSGKKSFQPITFKRLKTRLL